MSINILGVSSSMREKSRSAIALAIALEAARARGAEIRLLNLRLIDLPLYRPDIQVESPTVLQMRQQTRWADAMLLASPDYHGCMSGVMKNFLDFHHRDLTGKLCGFLCTSHEKGLTPIEQMRLAVWQCYGWSLPYGVSIHPENDFDQHGKLINPRLQSRLAMTARDLVVYGPMLHEQFKRDLASDEADTFAAKYR